MALCDAPSGGWRYPRCHVVFVAFWPPLALTPFSRWPIITTAPRPEGLGFDAAPLAGKGYRLR
jgi:hypothetical protein